MAVSAARAAAFDILLRLETQEAFASELLHSWRLEKLPSADRGLTTELVMGVLRWRSRLDANIQAASTNSLNRLDPEVLTVLRLAAYQLGWLERIPARAAVHESVELVKRARKRSAVGFVNVVLRKLAGKNHLAPTKDSNRASNISATASSSEIAVVLAHPPWLVESWAGQFGLQTAARICAYHQRQPTTALRLPPGETLQREIEDELKHDGIELLPGALSRDARRLRHGDLTKTSAFREGRVAIQDEASQLVAALLTYAVPNARTILDCCAAPGGKAAAMAQHLPQATIFASEIHPHRARLLRRMLSGSGDRVRVVVADATALPFSGRFDAVLADLPCSGTGTLARHPEIKWRLTPADLAALHTKQVAILSAGLRQLARGGRLLYSTCSLQPEENEEVIAEVEAIPEFCFFQRLDCSPVLQKMSSQRELTLPNWQSLAANGFLRTLPGVHPCDGFFAALFERVE
jgi:16S rRNA (cytosine967-C5)-methyltransferase